MTPIETLARIRDELEQVFVERAEVIDGALAALSHARTCSSSGRRARRSRCSPTSSAGASRAPTYFQWLLTKFTTPEELFGAVSLARARARRVPARHDAQAARGAHRVSRRGLQGELVDPERDPDADERAPLPQRPRRSRRAADHAVRRQQRAARGRRARRRSTTASCCASSSATSTRTSAS